MINFAHSMQGDEVMYSVEPSEELCDFATLVIAFASAWSTYGFVRPSLSPFSHSHTFSNPDGVPLYPSEIIILSLTISAPTLRLVQYEFSAHIRAIAIYLSSRSVCFLFSIIVLVGVGYFSTSCGS